MYCIKEQSFKLDIYLIFTIFQAHVPDAQVNGKVGRNTAFEVKVNDQEIHSKLKTMSFPSFDEVVNIVQDVSRGGNPRTVEKTQWSCIIL